MLDYKFDTQLLIEGHDSFYTHTPWKMLEYCASLGDILI